MFTFQYILRQFYLQIYVFAGPEQAGGIEDVNPLEGTSSPTVSPEGLAHNADTTARAAEAAHGELDDRMARLSEIEEGVDSSDQFEGTQEAGRDTIEDTGDSELEDIINPELRNEIITAMNEDERRDFESKTPEEQQEYLETQIQNRKNEEILDMMTTLGIEGLDGESLQSVFGEMTPDEIVEFEALSPEEQSRFMQERFESWRERTELILDQEEERLQQERVTASPQRQAQIDQRTEQIGQARESARGEGPGNTNFFRGEAARMTPEQLAEFGITGQRLAEYAATCTPSTGEEFMCGQNTGDALNGFYDSIDKPELKINDRPRHGYTWSQMLASRPNDYREVEVSAQDAPPGAIISYAAGPGGSVPFSQFGHVEIALGNGSYYFGQIAQSPGGSRRPPVEGQYRVFMPIALGNSEGRPLDAVSAV
ncbi:hypothetical protein LAT59_00260 [Candidatus Gracilibacteria bacterium]|nr:hypothetical protein [Candidatus Gracilibacteria bacterium]